MTIAKGYKIKAKYINVRRLGMVHSFFWHEPHMEEELFAEARDGRREISVLPTPCMTSREICPRPNSVLLANEPGYTKSHAILKQVLLSIQGLAKALQNEKAPREQVSPLIKRVL